MTYTQYSNYSILSLNIQFYLDSLTLDTGACPSVEYV